MHISFVSVGPNGIGKTATVYALAHEMGFKVLELNASSTRSGRQVLANLREATQSHSVKKRENSIDKNTKENLNAKKDAKPTEIKKSLNDGGRGGRQVDKTTLILFEDIDIAFDELDEGFYSAINSLIATTKRPIILTTSSPNFLAKTKSFNFKSMPQPFVFKHVQSRITARYLQLLCLVEGYNIHLDSLVGLVELNVGNISTSMHQLQYWVNTSTNNNTATTSGDVKENISKNQSNENFVSEETSDAVVEDLAGNRPCGPIEKEDSLAKLMSVRSFGVNVITTASLLHCTLPLMGLDAMAQTCKKAAAANNMSLILNNCDVLSKLFQLGCLLDVFDWNRHSLLPFPQRIVHLKRQARSTLYLLTASSTNNDCDGDSQSTDSSTSAHQVIVKARTKVLEKGYKRIILNNDSLFMTASEEDNSASEEVCGGELTTAASSACLGGIDEIANSPLGNKGFGGTDDAKNSGVVAARNSRMTSLGKISEKILLVGMENYIA